MKYTYKRSILAHYGYGTRNVVVPDQVASDERAFDGKSFPAWLCGTRNPKRVRVYLRGDLYGLRTTGTGDMRVMSAPRRESPSC